MTKPTKSLKNSFVFLETIFSILILSSILALFLNLNLSKESNTSHIQSIENQFLNKNYDSNFQIKNLQLNFIKNDTESYTVHVKQISFDNGLIRLKKYE